MRHFRAAPDQLARLHGDRPALPLPRCQTPISQGAGHIFNPAQAAYIEACFQRGYWPCGGGRHDGAYRAQQDAIRAEITAAVNALDEHGKAWPWTSIQRHQKWCSPSYRRDMAARNQRRRPYWRDRKRRLRATTQAATP